MVELRRNIIPSVSRIKGGSQEFYRVLEDLAKIHWTKSQDYGTKEDPFQNIRASEEFGIPPWLGAVIRGNDKVQRIKAFAVNGSLKNESLEDSLLDLASYAIIALVLYREDKKGKTFDDSDPQQALTEVES